MDIEYPCGKDVVEAVLPHRDPFCWVSRIVAFCILVERGAEGSIGFLTGIDGAKFRRQVEPGETLTLKGRIVKSSSRLCVAEVEASVDGAVCASATQKYVLAKAEA